MLADGGEEKERERRDRCSWRGHCHLFWAANNQRGNDSQRKAIRKRVRVLRAVAWRAFFCRSEFYEVDVRKQRVRLQDSRQNDS